MLNPLLPWKSRSEYSHSKYTNDTDSSKGGAGERIQSRDMKKLSVLDAGLKGQGLIKQRSTVTKGDFIVKHVGVAVKKQYLDGLLYIMALESM